MGEANGWGTAADAVAAVAGLREEISRGIAAKLSFTEIGRRIGRPACTVSREVGRNGGRARYRATVLIYK